MNTETAKSLANVLDYLMRDEKKDWEANGKPKVHIYLDLLKLNDFEYQELARTPRGSHLNQKDLEVIERIIYKNGDDIAVSVARSFERLEERIDAAESRIYSRIADTDDSIVQLKALIEDKDETHIFSDDGEDVVIQGRVAGIRLPTTKRPKAE